MNTTMHCSQQIRQSRNLTIILSVFLIITNTVSAAALHFLPSDPFNLAFNFALYCSCGALISTLGLIGVYRKSPALLQIFSNHLLLDALLSTVPRLLLLTLFSSLPTSTCASLSSHPSLNADSNPLVTQRCTTAVYVVEGVVAVALLGTTVLQWGCAWRVRDFASRCEEWEQKKSREGMALSEEEKMDV